MSRKGRLLREKKRAEKEAAEEKLRLAFSQKICPRKRNKNKDIDQLLCSKNKFHSRHPLANVFGYQDRQRLLKKMTDSQICFLEKLLNKTFDLELMHNADYSKALVRISEYNEFAIRPIEDWIASTHNKDRQFASLLRWLFVQYEMPFFMDSVWWDNDSRNFFFWYTKIGSGMSVYKVIKEDVDLTRKMTHWFMKAPRELSIKGALRWSQVLGFGGDERMAHAVINCNLANCEFNEFWSSLIHLFARNPMMDVIQIGPIVDYVAHQRRENEDYSLKGRTIDSLLKKTEEWHQQLAKVKKVQGRSWIGMDLPNWNIVTGKKKEFEPETQTLGKKQTLYEIKQIISGKELAAEGKAMRHCVYSYANACEDGRLSIWTLRKSYWEKDEYIEKRLLTIELNNQNKIVVQVRGFCNRLANLEEVGVLQKWAAEYGLSLAAYI